MLTLYELKQNSCFRCFYKSPYYIKNLFLMGYMAFLLSLIYVVYFRADGGDIRNIMNILNGLNSNTFNYLESQKSLIGLDDDVTTVTSFDLSEDQLTTEVFYQNCIRLNAPCKLEKMAAEWPALEKWTDTDEGKGKKYLKGVFGKEKIGVYSSSKNDKSGVLSRQHSF